MPSKGKTPSKSSKQGGGHDAHVTSQASPFKVKPPVVRVSRANGFDIQNDTGHAMWVALPEDLVPGSRGRRGRKARLAAVFGNRAAARLSTAQFVNPGDSFRFGLSALTGPRGRDYWVVVFTQDGPDPAEGNSPPKIIIQP